MFSTRDLSGFVSSAVEVLKLKFGERIQSFHVGLGLSFGYGAMLRSI